MLSIRFSGEIVIVETGVNRSLEVSGGVLNLRTTTSQRCESVPRRARV